MVKKFMSVCLGMLALVMAEGVLAHPADLLWLKTFGGPGREKAMSLDQTSDGGYIIAGSVCPGTSDTEDVHLIRVNTHGDTLWTRTYPNPGPDDAWSVQQTTDGGFIVTGSDMTTHSGGDIGLIRTDGSGNMIWRRTYGGPGFDRGLSVRETSDGGYIVTGFVESLGPGGTDVYLVRTDTAGDTVWTAVIGTEEDDAGKCVREVSAGGFIIAGWTENTSLGAQVYLVRADSRGDTLWTGMYGGPYLDHGSSVIETPEGGFVVAGSRTLSGGISPACMYIVKTDAAGDTVWTTTLGTADDPTGFAHEVITTDSGGYAVVGNHYTPSSDVYLVRLNESGDTLWTRGYGGDDDEHGYGVRQASDGGYTIAGWRKPFSGKEDIILVRTRGRRWTATEVRYLDPELNTPPDPVGIVGFTDFRTSRSSMTIRFSRPWGRGAVTIYDIKGRVVRSLVDRSDAQGHQAIVWNGRGEDGQLVVPGIYFVRLQAGGFTETKKCIILR
jgi:hypothetical protein